MFIALSNYRFIQFVIITTFLIGVQISLRAQFDNAGSGRAISFNGINDYVNFGDIYNDLKIPFTVSAWIYFTPSSSNSGGPIFANRNCTPIYTGFRLFVTQNSISVDCGDGLGGNNPAYRRGKQASLNLLKGNWIHVATVVRSFSDMDLYVNGINVGGTPIGGSGLTMDSSKPGFASTAYFTSNNIIYRYKDLIDEVRLWNRSLSEIEIRQDMCKKLIGNEPGLIGYWDFNETSGSTVFDKSPSGFHGQLIGNPTRVYSGAPIGDVSSFAYPASTLSLQDGTLKIEASSISGASGVHLYEVKSLPSQTIGLDLSKTNAPYFGVFLASQNAAGNFTAKTFFNDTPTCGVAVRTDNSISSWNLAPSPAANQSARGEYIIYEGALAVFDLGPDKIVCDQPSFTISTSLNNPAFSFAWNTGQTTPSISVDKSGLYSVDVTDQCGTSNDKIRIDFHQTPTIDLGQDKIFCDQTSYTISTQLNTPSFNFFWNTSQTAPSILVNQSGIYSVTVASPCGTATDKVQVDFIQSPPPFSFGADIESCDVESINLRPFENSLSNLSGLTFKWQDGSDKDNFQVVDFGKYWLSVKNTCGEVADTIMIKKTNYNVGFIPDVITPNGDGKNELFQISPLPEGLVSLKVLNRWGSEVFYSHSYKNHWDGSGLGTGVYFVVVEGPCIERFKGPLTIIR
jgi:hypothetical protein